MILALIKSYWRELTILIVSIFAYLQYNKEPRIVETTKVEYVDRVVERIVTVEKEVVKDKKTQTTVQKPDGTIITKNVTETTKEEHKTGETTTKREHTETQTEVKTTRKHLYNLGIGVKLYPDIEYNTTVYIRLGDLPLLIGPTLYVKQTESLQYGLGIGIEIEI